MLNTKQEIQDSYLNKQKAREYERQRFSHPFWRMAHQKEVSFINNFFKKIRPKKILEIAIGTGRVARNLKYFEEGVGLDNSQAMLDIAKAVMAKSERNETKRAAKQSRLMPISVTTGLFRRPRGLLAITEWKQDGNGKWTLIKGDAFELPFEKNSFDVVLSFRFIRHFPKQDREKILKQAHRVLKPGGYLIFEALNKNMGSYAKKITSIGKKNLFDKPIYDELWTREELKKELKDIGFCDIQFFPYLKILNNLWGIYQIAAIARLVGFGFIFKWLFGLMDSFCPGEPFQWEVVCKK